MELCFYVTLVLILSWWLYCRHGNNYKGFVYTCYHLATHILLSCSDTVGRCGMFCAIVTAIERCKTEGVVDVFQVVKALRVQKPGAIPTVVSD